MRPACEAEGFLAHETNENHETRRG